MDKPICSSAGRTSPLRSLIIYFYCTIPTLIALYPQWLESVNHKVEKGIEIPLNGFYYRSKGLIGH
jgi:hypothetical protein